MSHPLPWYALRLPTRWFLLVAAEAFGIGWLIAAAPALDWSPLEVGLLLAGAVALLIPTVRLACGAMHDWAARHGADFSRAPRPSSE